MPPYIGIDVGATNIKYLAIGGKGEVLFDGSIKTERADYNIFLTQLSDIIKNAQNDLSGIISGAGLLFPGFIDFKDKKIIASPNMSILNEKSIWNDLEKHVDIPFIIENDANGAAYGEFTKRRESDRSLRNMIMLTIGSGVGGGVIVDGSLLKGARGFAAELGHIKLHENGRECGCGSAGCAETYIGNGGITKTFLESIGADEPSLTVREIAEAANNGAPLALACLERAGKELGNLISILINIFNPTIIAVGGGIMNSAELILPAARKEAEAKSIPASLKHVRIEKAILGAEAGAIGAAMLAQSGLLNDDSLRDREFRDHP